MHAIFITKLRAKPYNESNLIYKCNSLWDSLRSSQCIEKILLRRSSTHDPSALEYLSHLESVMEINNVDFVTEMESRRMKNGRRFTSNAGAAEVRNGVKS